MLQPRVSWATIACIYEAAGLLVLVGALATYFWTADPVCPLEGSKWSEEWLCSWQRIHTCKLSGIVILCRNLHNSRRASSLAGRHGAHSRPLPSRWGIVQWSDRLSTGLVGWIYLQMMPVRGVLHASCGQSREVVAVLENFTSGYVVGSQRRDVFN